MKKKRERNEGTGWEVLATSMTWHTVMATGVCMSELLKLPTFGKCGSLFINHISIKLFVKRLAGKPVTPQERKMKDGIK